VRGGGALPCPYNPDKHSRRQGNGVQGGGEGGDGEGGGCSQQIATHNNRTHIPLSPCLSVRCVSGGGSMKNLHIAVQNKPKILNLHLLFKGVTQ
jgi:hypothetical protein